MVKLVFWSHLASWELSWVILGLSWVILGLSWASLGHLGPVLGFSWVILCLFCLLLASSEGNGCRELDREIGVLVTFGLLGAVLGPVGSLAFGFHGSPCFSEDFLHTRA